MEIHQTLKNQTENGGGKNDDGNDDGNDETEIVDHQIQKASFRIV